MTLKPVELTGSVKKILLTLAVIIAVVNTIIAGYEYVWPLIDTSGVIETGEYRGLSIGDSKRDVIHKIINVVYQSKMKIAAYRGLDGNTIIVFSESQSYRLRDSNTWILSYPGIHNEIVTLSFEDDRLYQISYKRNMFAP